MINTGRSGNREGYKIFSINTTVRNPKRNTDFLTCFVPYAGKIFTDDLSYQYFFDLIANGIYRVSDVPEYVKQKISNGEKLTAHEVKIAIDNNPQATGLRGRVMTQLRSMKDQGFLHFKKISRGKTIINITPLGQELIDGTIDATLVYSKAMIGLHAYSPIRDRILNKSRPFLNTLFVINEVKKEWENLGYEAKGVLQHEFSAFILSMKDCDYKKAANEIIKYRKKFKYELNMGYINSYLKSNDILPLKESSIKKDYPDDVFRKFEMTGLIVKRGMYGYKYYDFSTYNKEKIECLLKYYEQYKSEDFSAEEDYYNYLSNIYIPWLKNDIIRHKIIQSKEKLLKLSVDSSLPLSEQEEILDRCFYNKTLEKVIENCDFNTIYKELYILSGAICEKSKFDEISEPLRLEYLLAMLFGKQYGTKGLISNIIYGEDGVPLHFAPSKKCDIIYIHEDGSFILEPTMQRGKNQILNNETANVARHVKNETAETGIKYRAMMIAPYVHPDVIAFFQFSIHKNNVKIAPLNIIYVANLIYTSKSIKALCLNFDKTVEDLTNLDEYAYADKINKFSSLNKIMN